MMERVPRIRGTPGEYSLVMKRSMVDVDIIVMRVAMVSLLFRQWIIELGRIRIKSRLYSVAAIAVVDTNLRRKDINVTRRR